MLLLASDKFGCLIRWNKEDRCSCLKKSAIILFAPISFSEPLKSFDNLLSFVSFLVFIGPDSEVLFTVMMLLAKTKV